MTDDAPRTHTVQIGPSERIWQHTNVKEAVECYFDAAMKRPGLIRLHFVRDEVLVL